MFTDFRYLHFSVQYFRYFRYFSLRIISFRIQKIPFRFKAKQAKLTFFSLFRFAHFRFRFASFRFQAKWGDTLYPDAPDINIINTRPDTGNGKQDIRLDIRL